MVTKWEEVQQDVTGIYTKLLGTTAETLPTIDPTVVKNENVLNKHQQSEIIKHATR